MPKKTEVEKLKPCPFCGSGQYVQAYCNGWNLWSISCATCGVIMTDSGGGFIKKQDVVTMWNTRPNEEHKESN